jgi:hypothetical protein
VQLAKPPQRIVSLLPSLTESLCALGGCERLVGVDRYSNWPAHVKTLPVVGGGLDPNIEALWRSSPIWCWFPWHHGPLREWRRWASRWWRWSRAPTRKRAP